MARGWESKSVEEQIELAEARKNRKPEKVLTPAQLDAIRKRESLELSRKRVENEMAAAKNARYRAVLEKALSDLDAELAKFGPPMPS